VRDDLADHSGESYVGKTRKSMKAEGSSRTRKFKLQPLCQPKKNASEGL
jgi:hypothetical protein